MLLKCREEGDDCWWSKWDAFSGQKEPPMETCVLFSNNNLYEGMHMLMCGENKLASETVRLAHKQLSKPAFDGMLDKLARLGKAKRLREEAFSFVDNGFKKDWEAKMPR